MILVWTVWDCQPPQWATTTHLSLALRTTNPRTVIPRCTKSGLRSKHLTWVKRRKITNGAGGGGAVTLKSLGFNRNSKANGQVHTKLSSTRSATCWAKQQHLHSLYVCLRPPDTSEWQVGKVPLKARRWIWKETWHGWPTTKTTAIPAPFSVLLRSQKGHVEPERQPMNGTSRPNSEVDGDDHTVRKKDKEERRDSDSHTDTPTSHKHLSPFNP